MGIYSKTGLGTYPYMNARVRVMKGAMIGKDEYSRLIKMSPAEITKFMGETAYKKEIDELAMKYHGVDLIEAALYLNASRSFNKLIRISSGRAEMIIQAYLVRYDIYNLKTILRGNIAGMDNGEIRKLLIPAGRLDMAALDMLLKKETCSEIMVASKVVKIDKDVSAAIDECEKGKCLCSIENMLDKNYYNMLMELSLTMPKQGRYVRKFLKTEIDFLNLKVLFRLVREKLPKKDIVDKLVFSGEKLSRKKLLMLADSKDCEELYSGLSGTGYDAVLEKSMNDLRDKNELGAFEIALEKHWLRQVELMLHQHPLSVGPILGYMVGKDIEIRNLRMLVRAKVTGLDEKFMSDSVVV